MICRECGASAVITVDMTRPDGHYPYTDLCQECYDDAASDPEISIRVRRDDLDPMSFPPYTAI